MLEHRVFFIILFVAISLLGLEYIIVNNYVDKKTKPKKVVVSNKASNVSQLTKEEKEFLGINNTTYLSSNITNNKTVSSNKVSNTASNSNKATNNALDKKEETVEKKIEKENEETKKELSNQNISEEYLEYENLQEEEKSKVEVIPSKKVVDITELDDTNNEEITVLPTKYNLADTLPLKQRNQGWYGLCWDFASTLIAETYMKLNYNKEYDFSEIAVDYLLSEYMYGSRNYHRLHWGGSVDDYFGFVNTFGGLVESKYMNDNLYYNYSKEEYANILSLPRVSLGNYELVTFPKIKVFGNSLYDYSNNKITDEDMEKYRENMKKHLMTNSALGISINGNFSSKEPEQGDDLPEGEYANIPRQKAFYCTPEECPASNHVVAIIGWDDNFDRRVFKQVDSKGNVYYPKKDGAFIVANSWDKSLFYYISYENIQAYLNTFGIRKVESIDTSKYVQINTLGKMYQDFIYENLDSGEILTFNGLDYISYSNLALVRILELDGYIFTEKDIEDLKLFKGLWFLTIKNSNITNLDFLKNFTEINHLDFSNNDISDISGLEYATQVTNLNLSNNQITDISSLKKFYSLKNLILDNNKITNYNGTFDLLYSLSNLSMKNCGITDFELGHLLIDALNLSGNPGLNIVDKIRVRLLQLDNNNMNNLNILEKIDKERLETLSIVNNDIKDVSVLKDFANLNSINLSGNKNIENLNILKEIFDYNDKVENDDNVINTFLDGTIKNIVKKKEIESSDKTTKNMLFLNDCNISDITMFNDFNIELLSLAYNNITSVDNFNNSNIKKLDLSNNDLSSTDVSKLFKYNFTELYLSNVGIKSIILDESSNIEKLDLSNNEITDASFLNKFNSLYLLSLENNVNLNVFSDSFSASFINLANTGVDDTLIDKLNVENLKFMNLSSNKNITNMSSFIEKLYSKIYDKNEELKNKAIEGKDIMFEHQGKKYIKGEDYLLITEEYVNTEVLISDSIITNKPYNRYLRVYGNYEFTIPTSSDGVIELGNYENFDIAKAIWDNKIYTLHNVELDSTKTKVKVLGTNPYIELGNSDSKSGLFRISFK